MIPLPCLLSAALLQDASAPGSGLEEAFELPEGLQLSLWADSPQLFNPTAIDIDAEGRVWVAEAVNYRHFRNRPDERRWHEEGDRIVVLEDVDGDGRCDRSRVFAQGPELVSPLGVLVLGDGVLVSCSPSIVHYRDTDGDGRADQQQTWLEGWGGRDHDHGVHSVVFGPEGLFYLNTGNAGPHEVRARDGWTLRSGSNYGGGVGLLSDDGRAWVGGLVLRARPDGSALRVLAHNFRNCYEVAVDSYGDLFLADNDDDGNQGCRTVWVHEGGNYGYTSADGARSWRVDRRPDQSTQEAHWHQHDPGVMPAGCINGSGGPTGVAIYEGFGLPADWQGAVLNCDAGRKVVYGHRPVPSGSGIELQSRVFLGARDGQEESRWYRPSDVCVAPDGSVLVADWWDPGVGGHAAGDREARGRILRVHWPQAVAPEGDSLRDRLASPSMQVRHAAAEQLRARGEDALDVLEPELRHEDPTRRARAQWIAAEAGERGRHQVERALQDPHPRVRVAALRALRRVLEDPLPLLARVARSSDAGLRREACVALRDLPRAQSMPLLLALAERLESGDRWALEALGLAAEGKEADLFAELVAANGVAPIDWSEAFADLAWRLHPLSAASSFAARAMALELPIERRLQAVDALAHMPEGAAARTMAELHRAAEGAVRTRAAYWLRHRAENDWSEEDVLAAAGLRSPRPERPVWRSGVMRSGVAEVTIDLRGVERLWLVVEDGGDGFSCDWADWLEPTLHAEDGSQRLTEREWSSAETGWGGVHVDRNANGGPLRVGDTPFAFGIGTHANSEIAYDLDPDRFHELRMQVGPDAGGTGQQGGAVSSVEFLVYTQRVQPAVDLRPQQAELLAEQTSASRRRALARELAMDRQGGLLLIQLAQAEHLPDEVRETVRDAIHRNPDLGVRTLASQFFPRADAGGGTLPPIAELAEIAGDAARGRALFFDEEVACSRCHGFGGSGGALGPDLTPIHEKLDRTGLLDAILNPSAAILMGYETWMLETTAGMRHVGFLLADGDKVVLRDTEGVKHVLDADHIEFRKRMSLSAMPDDVSARLDPQQLADLVEFLLSRPPRSDGPADR